MRNRTFEIASLTNLDLPKDQRREAMIEAAEHLEHLSGCSEAAMKVMNVVLSQAGMAYDQLACLRHASQDLMAAYGQASDQRNSSTVEAFLRVVDHCPTAVIESDVDGLKGTFALRDGKVIRLAGKTPLPFEHGAEGLSRIEQDGAYSVVLN